VLQGVKNGLIISRPFFLIGCVGGVRKNVKKRQNKLHRLFNDFQRLYFFLRLYSAEELISLFYYFQV
jgi:hypothetical protein